MQCPKCGNDMAEGYARSGRAGGRISYPVLYWYPDDEKGRIFKKDVVYFKKEGEGYYCEKCRKLYAIFDQK